MGRRSVIYRDCKVPGLIPAGTFLSECCKLSSQCQIKKSHANRQTDRYFFKPEKLLDYWFHITLKSNINGISSVSVSVNVLFDPCLQFRLVTAARGLCQARPQCSALCWMTMTTLQSSCSHPFRSAPQKTCPLGSSTLLRPLIQTMGKTEPQTTP